MFKGFADGRPGVMTERGVTDDAAKVHVLTSDSHHLYVCPYKDRYTLKGMGAVKNSQVRQTKDVHRHALPSVGATLFWPPTCDSMQQGSAIGFGRACQANLA